MSTDTDDTDTDTDADDNITEELRNQNGGATGSDEKHTRGMPEIITGPPWRRATKRKADTEHSDMPPMKRRWLEY
jgi:hypothetical protein